MMVVKTMPMWCNNKLVQVEANLNKIKITDADGPDVPIRNKGDRFHSPSASVEAVFDRLEARLCEIIRDYPVVVGSMAWLTNPDILTALQGRDSVSIVVNKEDFLRPDSGNTWSQQKTKLLYSKLPGFDRMELGRPYSYGGDPSGEAVRCVGICANRSDIPPRMHHKFLVFCRFREEVIEAEEPCKPTPSTPQRSDDEGLNKMRALFREQEERNLLNHEEAYRLFHEDNETFHRLHDQTVRIGYPVAVWTGSFNATFNATQSLENAVIITDPVIAGAYFEEWCDMIGLSEPLDWTSPYVEPEWRFGT